jgi:putative transport protein
MSDVSAFFGDSYRALSEVDILTFSLGIALGLGLGAISIPLPGGIEFKLGIAGGPLVVALLLGTLERTGRLTWTVPYSANLTLRQFGLILFLAGIGTRAGFAFRETLGTGQGAAFLVSGVVLSVTVSVVAIWTARRLLALPMGIAIGMLAGLQTQPAVLSFAQETTDDDLPNTGYAMVFPVAMIAKILAAQILLLVFL